MNRFRALEHSRINHGGNECLIFAGEVFVRRFGELVACDCSLLFIGSWVTHMLSAVSFGLRLAHRALLRRSLFYMQGC
jgi:hypothetical protein